MAMEDEQRLKDMLRAIEAQETIEDLGDPEEYDDMGGIKSLDRGAPSIKLASETGPEELELELMSVIREFNDRMEKGELDPSITVDEYINMYLSRKKMIKDERAMAAYGGRMQYADGMKDPTYKGNNLEDLPEGLKKDTTTYPLGQDPKYKGKMIIDISEKLKKLMKEKEDLPEGLKRDTTTGQGANIKSIEELLKKPKSDAIGTSILELKKLFEKRKKEKKKLAKGGIAGVL
jgi:uncharacterized protein (DUF3820 family)